VAIADQKLGQIWQITPLFFALFLVYTSWAPFCNEPFGRISHTKIKCWFGGMGRAEIQGLNMPFE
jgi:hypothetical protein